MGLSVKSYLSPEKLKLLYSAVISVFVMALLFILNGIVLKDGLRFLEKRYFDNCSQVLQGYSNGFQHYFENYNTSLNSIYDEELFEKGDGKTIQKWIIRNIKYLSPDFCSVFYVDSNSVGYFSQGDVIDLTGKSYLTPGNFKEDSYYVTDLFFSVYTSEPIFIIEKPYFDKNKKLKGILCASIKIKKLDKVTDHIKIGEHSTVYVLDRLGHVLTHPDEDFIGKVFFPKSEKYKNVTSDVTARLGNGYVETENHLGESIDLFYTQVKGCDWILCAGFPKKYLRSWFDKFKKIRFFIILIGLVSLALLLLVQNSISDYFYTNQLISPIYDPLTRLWTRQKFESEAAKILAKNSHGRFALIEADIRSFNMINQNYGAECADRMIFFFSQCLNKIVQKFGGIIAHGYADRFYILLRFYNIRSSMRRIEGELKFLESEIRSYAIPFFPKYGITLCKPSRMPVVSISELITQAGFAKNTIRNNSLANCSIYNAAMFEKLNEEQYIESCMEDGLKNGEFFVMYQPKIRLSDDTIVGSEALVRWKTKHFGLLSPDKFIPLFERNGFIVKLDFYVYEQVFKFIDSQIKKGNPVVPVSINMSRNHNDSAKFMQDFMSIFNRYSIPSNLIQIEIVERSVMDKDCLCDITDRLHKEGFSVAMDDFGSGESSLNMLTKVPVDVLKFDREFLLSSMDDNGALDEKSAKFIQSLIELSKHLDKETIFEGVETLKQRNFLKSIKCDQVQGYFYSKPLSESDYEQFILEHISHS